MLLGTTQFPLASSRDKDRKHRYAARRDGCWATAQHLLGLTRMDNCNSSRMTALLLLAPEPDGNGWKFPRRP